MATHQGIGDGRMTQAFSRTRKAAEAGSVADVYRLGLMYANGVGVEKDETRALACYRQAAAGGHAEAQYILASRYERGEGVVRDEVQAFSWNCKAAEQGDERALVRLGQYLESPQPRLALSCFLKAGDKGKAAASFALGLKYAEGAERDPVEAFDHFLNAAELDHPAAQYRVGLMYARGDGVRRDEKLAQVWLEKAAAHGEAAALNLLAEMLAAQNPQLARARRTQAAEAGNADAQFNLASHATSEQEARSWLMRAADQGHGLALLQLAEIYARREDGQALLWYRKAADRNVAQAHLALGRHALTGDGPDWLAGLLHLLQAAALGGVPALQEIAQLIGRRHRDIALSFLEKAGLADSQEAQHLLGEAASAPPKGRKTMLAQLEAAKKGDVKAQWHLAQLYAQGSADCPRDPAQSLNWLEKAVAQGFAAAQARLGIMYASGQGVPKSETKAVLLFRLAATQGDAESQFNLALLLQKGMGTKASPSEARTWYRLAAEQGVRSAQANLGLMLATGQGGETDLAGAYQWFSLAAARGDQTARANLQYAETRMTPEMIADGKRLAREWSSARKRAA